MSRNLYRIDDVLLKTGWIALLLVLGAASIAFLVGFAGEPGGSQPAGLHSLARFAPQLLLAGLCPIVLLSGGTALRRREKRIGAVWTLLQRSGQLDVASLLANSDFERADLERAVKLVNNRALGHYVWDRRADVIQDARLQHRQLHVEKCDLCRASISVDVPIAFTEVPRCPYCGDPVSIDGLEARRQEALAELRAEHRPAAAAAAGPGGAPGPAPAAGGTRLGLPPDFSIAVFIVLALVFWPAALLYAGWKWQKAR